MENSERDGNTRPPDLPLKKFVDRFSAFWLRSSVVSVLISLISDTSSIRGHKKKKKKRNLYAGQEATVRTGHGTTDWFQIGKGVRQGSILSPCLFNLYAEYIMRNARLEETQTGIKIARRNNNNLRYADDMQVTPPLWQKVKRI